MDRAITRDGLRDPLRRCVQEAVLASVSLMLITLAKRPRRISRKIGRRRSVVNPQNRPLLRQTLMIALRVQRILPTRSGTRFIAAPLSAKTNRSGRNSNTAIAMMFCGRARRPHRSYASCGATARLRSTPCDFTARDPGHGHQRDFRCPEEGGLMRRRREVTFVRTEWGVSDPRRSGPGTASGGWQRGSLTPHTTLISHPRGLGGGEERRLDHQHGTSGSRGSSMTCHATPAAESFRSVRMHRCLPLRGQGEHCSRVCVPPPAPPLSAPGGAAVVLF